MLDCKPPLQLVVAFEGPRGILDLMLLESNLWHFRLGHPGPMTLEKLGISCLGAHLKGPTTVQCRHCCQGKMHRQISRRTPYRPSTPFEEIWIDWSDFTEDYQGYSRVMFITDAYSGMVFPYFLQSHGLGRENRRILQDFFNYIDKQYGFQVKSIRSDNELFSKVVRMELQQRSIRSNPSAPNTQSQNGGAERSGGVIIEKARSMRISARLPHSLWRHVIESACYLRNRTPLSRNNWKSPYEQVFNKLPSVTHLKAYGCRAYAMTAAAQLKTNRRKKLDPRAQLGYLVGYASTNIFKIWVPHKDKVILTRDVLFDENTFFDNKLQLDLLDSVKELIEDFESSKVQPSIWEDDSEEEDSIDQLEDPFDEDYQPSELGSEQNSQQDDQQEEDLQEDQGLLTPPPSDIDFEEGLRSVFATQLPVAQPEGVRETGPAICPISRNVSGHIPTHTLYDTSGDDRHTLPSAYHSALGDSDKGIKDSLQIAVDFGNDAKFNAEFSDSDSTYRFHEFHPIRIESALHGSFNAGLRTKTKIHKRNLPEPPKTHRDLTNHPFKDQFIKAQQDHLASHDTMGSFEEVSWNRSKGQRVLSCMWVFVYKTDKHGFLVKCKARLVVCGNQQAKGDLPTRATTLASMSFRALMAIAAEYDLELEQMDAVNAFVNCNLDEVVYMRLPPGYEKAGKVLRLRKALYGLRRSPLLWQKDLTTTIQDLGFTKIPQEPCVMRKGSIFVFFFVDDIIWAYPKADTVQAKEAIKGLMAKYEVSYLGEPKWFLGIHILRDRRHKTIWLAQDAYIEKIAYKFDIKLDGKMPTTPMGLDQLLPSPTQATKQSIELYQQKIGSILFAAISTRPDIAFAVSRLARYNLNPSQVHHDAADRVIQYLHTTRSLAVRLGGLSRLKREVFICASDASYGDNPDRKSSQGYVMMLFNGPIAWKASKQPTVTTSSTEAELLAISEAAKEAIFASRLLQALQVELKHPLYLECDNSNTIRLLTEEATKLTTQLRHVDIHQHWLRQEVQNKRISVNWVKTADMVADGMTKALPKVKHQLFIKQLQMEDIRNRIALEAQLEEAKDRLINLRKRDQETDFTLRLGYKGGHQKSDPTAR